jgi:hypothetical protein
MVHSKTSGMIFVLLILVLGQSWADAEGTARRVGPRGLDSTSDPLATCAKQAGVLTECTKLCQQPGKLTACVSTRVHTSCKNVARQRKGKQQKKELKKAVDELIKITCDDLTTRAGKKQKEKKTKRPTPSSAPSTFVTGAPTTGAPTSLPTLSAKPSISARPTTLTSAPTFSPTTVPAAAPSKVPSKVPTRGMMMMKEQKKKKNMMMKREEF